jgi:competence protein ComEC
MNVYGHPHKELLERLKKAGSKILMTKDSGAVRVETDGENILVDGYLK